MRQLAAQENYSQAAHNPFEKFGAEFFIERKGGKVLHLERHRSKDGSVVAEEAAEAAYVLGSGSRGRSYLIDHNGALFQSPISWFAKKAIWDISPGYLEDTHFRRPVRVECLFCHCNYADPVPDTINHYRRPIFTGHAIGCERCHGPGALHVQGPPSAGGTDDTIVNPARLEPRLRDAVCEQCHLQGDVRILRRGRQAFDYRPGLPLDQFWSIFIRKPELKAGEKAVSQVEQMYASHCYRGSDGRLACTSCHDPHTLPAPEKRLAFYRERCQQCHEQRPCSVPSAERRRKSKDNSCMDCHMPRATSADVAHIAVTDHRILRMPEKGAKTTQPARRLLPTESPLTLFQRGPALPEKEAARDLGLALIDMARQSGGPLPHLGRMALPLLDAAVQDWPNDLPASEGRAYALWLQGRAADALTAYETTLANAPRREQALVDAAMLCEQLDREEAAIGYWRRAIEVNGWRSQAHYQLAMLFARRHLWPDAIVESRQAVQQNPTSLEKRLLLVSCYARTGQKDKARAEFETVLALNPPDPKQLRQWFGELNK
jgi:tetratricopeptide (TPR) repeat protein